jgi:hypothetical protein
MEPSSRILVLLTVSRWRALMLMAEAEHRTPQQQLAALLDKWWAADPACQRWQEALYEAHPEMREPHWWIKEE